MHQGASNKLNYWGLLWTASREFVLQLLSLRHPQWEELTSNFSSGVKRGMLNENLEVQLFSGLPIFWVFCIEQGFWLLFGSGPGGQLESSIRHAALRLTRFKSGR